MTTYTKTDLQRTRGWPFCMAFVYSDRGTLVYTGSKDVIMTHLATDDIGFCHAVFHTHIKGGINSNIELVGYRSGPYSVLHYPRKYLKHPEQLLGYRKHVLEKVPDKVKKHNFYVVYHVAGGVYDVDFTLRKFPKSYVKQFKDMQI